MFTRCLYMMSTAQKLETKFLILSSDHSLSSMPYIRYWRGRDTHWKIRTSKINSCSSSKQHASNAVRQGSCGKCSTWPCNSYGREINYFDWEYQVCPHGNISRFNYTMPLQIYTGKVWLAQGITAMKTQLQSFMLRCQSKYKPFKHPGPTLVSDTYWIGCCCVFVIIVTHVNYITWTQLCRGFHFVARMCLYWECFLSLQYSPWQPSFWVLKENERQFKRATLNLLTP